MKTGSMRTGSRRGSDSMKESGGKVVVRVEGLRGQRKSRGREGVLERMRTVNPDQQPR